MIAMSSALEFVALGLSVFWIGLFQSFQRPERSLKHAAAAP